MDALEVMFEHDLQKAVAVTLDSQQRLSLGRRLFIGGARLFSPML